MQTLGSGKFIAWGLIEIMQRLLDMLNATECKIR